MALGQSIRNAIGSVWGAVLSAVGRGQDVAQTVGAAVERIGTTLAPPELLDTSVVQQLQGYANSWVAAREAFGRAEPGDQIDASMITLAPWSADLNTHNAAPSFHIILGISVEGLEGPVYRTVTGITDLPPTVGELQQASLVNAIAMSTGTTPGGGVGGTVTGIDSLTITVGPAAG